MHAMASPSKPLRQTGGTSVAVIVGVGGLQNWPELIQSLTTSLESNDRNSLEGGLDALYKASTKTCFFIQSLTCYFLEECLISKNVCSSKIKNHYANALMLHQRCVLTFAWTSAAQIQKFCSTTYPPKFAILVLLAKQLVDQEQDGRNEPINYSL